MNRMEYEPDEDEKRDAWEAKRKRNQGCKCGYPDWPGSCPGPANCPMCQEDDDIKAVDGRPERPDKVGIASTK